MLFASFDVQYLFRLLYGTYESFLLPFLFLCQKKHKKFFILRLLAVLAIYVITLILLSQLYALADGSQFIYPVKCVVYIVFYSIILGLQFLLYDGDAYAIVLECLTAFVALGFLSNVTGLLPITLRDVIEKIIGIKSTFIEVMNIFLQLLIKSPFYFLIWFFFSRNIKDIRRTKSNAIILMMMFVTIVTDACISAAIGLYEENSRPLALLTRLTIIVLMAVMLIVKKIFLNIKKLENELAISQQLLSMGQKQYEEQKENMKIIDIKCHDIKHFLRQYGDKMDESERKGIENSISAFEKSFDVKHPTINTILNMKNTICLNEGIRMTAFGDASGLSALKDGDIYSFLSNAVDNAIEAVQKIDGESKKCIDVSFTKKEDSTEVEFLNYFTGEVKFSDNIIKTSKNDDRYHGFGVLSIKTVVEKYGGNFSYCINDDIFILTLVFPNKDCADNVKD